MNSTATIFARLTAVVPSLDTYTPPIGPTRPAIFNERAPDDFLNRDPKPAKPFLIIAVPTRDEPLETFTETGRLILQDVRGYQRDTGSGDALSTGAAAPITWPGPDRSLAIRRMVRRALCPRGTSPRPGQLHQVDAGCARSERS